MDRVKIIMINNLKQLTRFQRLKLRLKCYICGLYKGMPEVCENCKIYIILKKNKKLKEED